MSRPRITYDVPYVFISHRTVDGKPFFSDQWAASHLIDILRGYEWRGYYRLHTYCVMPDHHHIVLQLTKQKSVTQILHGVHSLFAHEYGKRFGIQRIWNRRPWIVWLFNEDMLRQKTAYTLLNPWRAGLVIDPLDSYPFSNIDEWKKTRGEEYLRDLFGTYGRRWE